MAEETNISEAGMTMEDFLYGCVNFRIPEEAMASILARVDVNPSDLYSELDGRTRRLCEAKLYEWIATSPSRIGDVSDSDNNWRHSEGGFSFSEADRRFYLSLANSIYDELDMPKVGCTKVRVKSYGIRRADIGMNGMPLPHII